MESKLFIVVIIAHTLFASSVTSAEENVTEKIGADVSAATSESVLKERNLPFGENEVEGKAKRNPKFGFTIPIPNIPGVGGGEFSTTPNPETHIFGGATGDIPGVSSSIGTTAILIKGGILSGLLALKASILPPVFLGALIIFLIAGAAFFTCSIVNCGRFIGDVASGPGAPGFGGLPQFNPFNRNGIDEYEQRPIFQALDEGYKKFH